MILLSSGITFLLALSILYFTPCESLKCYGCSGSESCGQGANVHLIDCAGKCMSYRKVGDNNGTIVRGCCTDDCDIEREHKVYFCAEDTCNGIASDGKLRDVRDGIVRRRIHRQLVSAQDRSSLSCYECTGHSSDCADRATTAVQGCQSCMVYLNANDGNNVIRRCCKSGCGSADTVEEYEGRRTYFCSSNLCNGIGAEKKLTNKEELETTMATVTASSIKPTTSTSTTTTTIQTSFSCYDCSNSNNQGCAETTSNCPMCMVYRNDNDPTKFDRRCCWWACGLPNQVTTFAGRPTYFCNADKCNGPGSESMLNYATTTSTTAVTRTTSTTTTTTTTQQTSFQCYDCSGSECGKGGSSLTMNCPSCMVYRNPNDQTQIERRCCWWNCGPSNTVSTYNGLETFFCTSNKCNQYGAEWALSRPVTTTSTTKITTPTFSSSTTTTASLEATTTTTTSSFPSSCVLNCQNGGTPETKDGCFCYCLDNTSGRQCENVACTQFDTDSETCSPENQPLCEESETFAFECLHLCQKC